MRAVGLRLEAVGPNEPRRRIGSCALPHIRAPADRRDAAVPVVWLVRGTRVIEDHSLARRQSP